MLPDRVVAAVRAYQTQGTPTLLLACSGGVDSQVLVHAAAAAWPGERLVVAHVHHGLQPEADDWLAFCAASAAELGLRFLSRRLLALPEPVQGGVEAWARRRRYQALAEMAAEAQASYVLTAHHANDQLETYQLRRLRGAGPLGLGAMRPGAPLPGAADRLLLRPFLDVERSRILAYAIEHHLRWVEDPSNQDLRYARNRVRHEMAQALNRDPQNLQRGLAEIGGFQQLADRARRQARSDLAASRVLLAARSDRWGGPTGLPVNGMTSVSGVADVAGPAGAGRSEPGASLSRAALARLPQERAAEAIRLWLADLGCRMPSRATLAEILRQLLHARSSHARLYHDGRWLLRYRDRIDAAADLPTPLAPVWFRWAGEPLLEIAGQRFLFHQETVSQQVILAGIDATRLAGADILLDTALGSDRLRPTAGAHLRSWRNLAQERGIAPWVRLALPVLRQGGRLLYAAPFGLNRDAETGCDLGYAKQEDASLESACERGPTDSATGGAGSRVLIEWCVPPEVSRWL